MNITHLYLNTKYTLSSEVLRQFYAEYMNLKEVIM